MVNVIEIKKPSQRLEEEIRYIKEHINKNKIEHIIYSVLIGSNPPHLKLNLLKKIFQRRKFNDEEIAALYPKNCFGDESKNNYILFINKELDDHFQFRDELSKKISEGINCYNKNKNRLSVLDSIVIMDDMKDIWAHLVKNYKSYEREDKIKEHNFLAFVGCRVGGI